ncbi:MAG: LPS assembly lipoprotein LptE [Pseudomonadota bacterium]
MSKPTRAILVVAMLLILQACGFHLRGHDAFVLPVQTLYVQSPNDLTPFIIELKRVLQDNNVQLSDTAEQAQLTLQIVSEKTDKQILSLSSAGRVLEYRLQYRVSLRAYDSNQHEWLAPEEITLGRVFSYDDTRILAKEQEENLLYLDMRNDAVQQVLRRLNRARAPQPGQ